MARVAPARGCWTCPGRSGATYATWLAARDQHFRDHIQITTMDPFHGYKYAIDGQREGTIAVLDALHIVKPGGQAIDEVRRRVQQQTTTPTPTPTPSQAPASAKAAPRRRARLAAVDAGPSDEHEPT